MQFTFEDKGEVYLLDESVLSVTEKERRREGKRNIGPKMKYCVIEICERKKNTDGNPLRQNDD